MIPGLFRSVAILTNGYNILMQLITLKLFISPAPADYVPRPQLLRKLGQVPGYKLTILSAPAGFGKTTLLGAWFREKTVQSVRIQPCWLSLDPEDNDPGRFLEALLSSLEDAGISLDTASSFPPIVSTTNYRSVLNAVVRDLSNLPNEVVLAFDDYHVIENQEVHELVSRLIARAPQSFHILISTRTQPPFETGKLRVSGQLLEIGPADLRFTLDETRAYLHLSQDFSFPEKDIVTIAEKTEGWIAGLKMAVLAIRKSEDPSAFVKVLHGGHRYIFDYLMEQVLIQQPPEVKDFLIASSVVDSFNASLCDALIQEGNYPPGTSQRILAYLEQANLFIVPLDDERQWFRYHHLFSELLRSILRQTLPHKVSTLNRYASAWYERQRLIPDAVSHAIAAGDVERAARMISANVLLLVEQTELKTILLRLDALFSSGEVVEDPSLKIAYAWVLAFWGEMKRATDVLRTVEAQALPAADIHDKNERLGNLQAVQAYIQWVDGYHGRAVELGRQAEEQLSSSNTAVRALNLTTLASVLLKLDQYEEALQFAQQGVDIGKAINQPTIVMLAMTSLAYVYHDLGQIGKSSEVCESALEQADDYRRKHGRILASAAGVYAIQAHNFYWQHDLERAYWYARRALAFSEIWGQADITFVAAWIMARVLSARNNPEAALKVIEMVKQATPLLTEWTFYLVKLLEGHIYFECGNLEGARKTIGELTEFDGKINLDLANFYLHCDLSIKVLITDGEYENALDRIDQLLAHFKDNKGGYKTNALVLRAWACHKKGNDGEAISALETALQYAEPESHVLPFVETFQYLQKPLRSIAGKGLYKGMLDRIFAVCQVQASGQSNATNKSIRPDVENLIEPLTERELEILRLLNSHLSTPEIADMLAVSVNTVRTHIKSIYSKLGVHSRSTAIDVSKKLKLLA